MVQPPYKDGRHLYRYKLRGTWDARGRRRRNWKPHGSTVGMVQRIEAEEDSKNTVRERSAQPQMLDTCEKKKKVGFLRFKCDCAHICFIY